MKSLSILLLSLLILPAAQAAAPAAPTPSYKEGVNYQPVLPAQPTSTVPGQIEVLDFFWYGCPHCNAFEPYLVAWERSKPANVVLVRVPATLEPDWEVGARAYYTAEALGIIAKAHSATFTEIHLKGDNLQTEQDFERYYGRDFGVEPKKFESAWNSPAVDAKLAQAKVLSDRYEIMLHGVPTLIVNGKWLTGGEFGVGSPPQIISILNYLVGLEQTAIPANVK